MSSIPPPQPYQSNESLEHNMPRIVTPEHNIPHIVTPEPLDMNVQANIEDIRRPVARVLFPADEEIEDPPPLVRSVAAVVPWDEEEFPEPPTLRRQNAGDGTAVEWSSSDEEEEEDEDEEMDTLSISSEYSLDDQGDFQERCQQLAQEGELLMEQMNHLVTLLGRHSI